MKKLRSDPSWGDTPSLSYVLVLCALRRLDFVVLRQKGSHIRLMRKFADGKIQLITVPAHKSVSKWTLAKILKGAGISLRDFLDVL